MCLYADTPLPSFFPGLRAQIQFSNAVYSHQAPLLSSSESGWCFRCPKEWLQSPVKHPLHHPREVWLIPVSSLSARRHSFCVTTEETGRQRQRVRFRCKPGHRSILTRPPTHHTRRVAGCIQYLHMLAYIHSLWQPTAHLSSVTSSSIRTSHQHQP